MAVKILHGSTDDAIAAIASALETYAADHPDAAIDLYRHDSVSVWVRVIDPAFASWHRSGRHSHVWRYLEQLPDEVLAEIGLLALVAPGENSLANLVYQEPLPSAL